MTFWEDGSYAEYFAKQRDKFQKETAAYLIFMEERHKIVTLDYIASLENMVKMQKYEIEHLRKLLDESTKT